LEIILKKSKSNSCVENIEEFRVLKLIEKYQEKKRKNFFQ